MPENIMDWITLILTITGALNWGLYGLMGMDIIALLFGSIPILATIMYMLIALSGLWMLYQALTNK